jgi:peptidoglycan/LPS O-acetylase OafA/YrhL
MAGAELVASDRLRTTRLRSAPWGVLALVLFAAVAAIILTDNADWPYPVVDLVVSLFALALILACATSRSAGTARVSRFFSWRPMLVLGAFSYSIYLLQHPLLRLSEEVLERSPLGYEAGLWVLLVVGLPVLLALCWAFAELFELPFTTGSHVLGWVSRVTGGRRHPARPATASAATLVE